MNKLFGRPNEVYYDGSVDVFPSDVPIKGGETFCDDKHGCQYRVVGRNKSRPTFGVIVLPEAMASDPACEPTRTSLKLFRQDTIVSWVYGDAGKTNIRKKHMDRFARHHPANAWMVNATSVTWKGPHGEEEVVVVDVNTRKMDSLLVKNVTNNVEFWCAQSSIYKKS